MLHYDILSLNIGGTTKGWTAVEGAESYAISTKPINELIKKIKIKENSLIET